ncbi:Hypothetical predicted protein [Paramuricea clavata]|uniref:Uncharacterized protein n=1 Tax=Paramuricea clavata TaxID=317549 RepID=A0A7D9LIZ0_PARCT|nr:Hypothetical predicted protein [Paramuricea clavata]CAB4033853.1 Hypothetical predicted protein [Paramuricea clavata]
MQQLKIITWPVVGDDGVVEVTETTNDPPEITEKQRMRENLNIVEIFLEFPTSTDSVDHSINGEVCVALFSEF